jgi:predicted ATPase
MADQRQRIVISGGSHSGKTTLLQALRARGYTTVPEAAMLVIDGLNRQRGLEAQIRWREAHPADFQELVADRQLRLEAGINTGAEDRVDGPGESPVFLDRGLLDGLAYCEFRRIPPPPGLAAVPLHNRYSHVYVLATITPYVSRIETGRTGTEDTSRRIGELIYQTYAAHGYNALWVGQMPVEARVEFILGRLSI